MTPGLFAPAPVSSPASAATVHRVLDAAKSCSERWGYRRVTIDDIAAESGVSRATLYRLFPGGKETLFEALRVRHLEDFFARLTDEVRGVDSLDELLVRTVVAATHELRADASLAMMLASEPGAALGQLTVEGLPRIIRMATAFLAPLVGDQLPHDQAAQVVDLLARLVISYFLVPSDHVDLGDPESAGRFVRNVVLTPASLTTGVAP